MRETMPSSLQSHFESLFAGDKCQLKRRKDPFDLAFYFLKAPRVLIEKKKREREPHQVASIPI